MQYILCVCVYDRGAAPVRCRVPAQGSRYIRGLLQRVYRDIGQGEGGGKGGKENGRIVKKGIYERMRNQISIESKEVYKKYVLMYNDLKA